LPKYYALKDGKVFARARECVIVAVAHINELIENFEKELLLLLKKRESGGQKLEGIQLSDENVISKLAQQYQTDVWDPVINNPNIDKDLSRI
jgi:hypothetical protein